MSERRFLADKTVGRLAKWLRLLGYDCRTLDSSDVEEILLAIKEDTRTLLTKNTKFLAIEKNEILFIKSDDITQQLKQVIMEYSLSIECERFLSVCSVCNVPVVDVETESVRGLVPPFVFATRKTFRRCPQCGRLYWAGTHKTRMIDRLKETLDSERQQSSK
ncbi:MAG TPA: Mut7-C RNAse domain-containing protein [bacterium]|nr:Mut7-C RNAse domain-containing protein [bacterium]